MGQQNIDRNQLKSVLREILVEEPQIFAAVLAELKAEFAAGRVSQQDAERQARIVKMIEEDFNQYDEVFQALA